MRFRNIPPRNSRSVVKDYGHIELSAACIKANKTGYFALGERIKPDSYDGNDTNIEPDKCFVGGRKIDVALTLKRASDLANTSVTKSAGADDSAGVGSGDGE